MATIAEILANKIDQLEDIPGGMWWCSDRCFFNAEDERPIVIIAQVLQRRVLLPCSHKKRGSTNTNYLIPAGSVSPQLGNSWVNIRAKREMTDRTFQIERRRYIGLVRTSDFAAIRNLYKQYFRIP